ncbi:MAG: GTP cyclohydrolase II [Chloroflexi bacterium]|nr:GTP cyclohydrolase II [Chloroflexota bacterium]
MVSARIPAAEGEFELALYMSNRDDKEHLALIYGDVRGKADVLARVHSECFTGDVLGSRRCDCGEHPQRLTRRGHESPHTSRCHHRAHPHHRRHPLLSQFQHRRNQGYDTVEANLALGHQADERDYGVAALALEDLGVPSIRLLTNNPHKIESLRQLGVRVTARVPLQPTVHADNAHYLRTKAERMRHLLTMSAAPGL